MKNKALSVKALILILFTSVLVSPAWAVRLKIATLSPEGSVWMTKMQEAAKQVAEQTENRVTLKFYPGGVMGNDKAVLRKIRIGQLHGGALMSGSLSRFFSSNQIYSQPVKFSNIEEVEHVRKHMDKLIIQGLDDSGFVVFGLSGLGFSYIMSQEPIRTVEDLKKQKIWIPDNEQLNTGAIKAFDISPIPLPIADVRTSLQSGLINTVANSPAGAVILQWHTQIKYITNVPLIYLHAVLAFDKKKFMKIREQDRESIRKIMVAKIEEVNRDNRKTNQKAIETLKKRGVVFINPTEEELKVWRQTGRKASENMVKEGLITKDIADELDRLLMLYQSNAQASATTP